MNPTAGRTVYRAFKDAAAYIDDIYSLYERLYMLPKFIHSEQVSDIHLFEYCQDRRYFVNILPYTKNRHFLLSPTLSGQRLDWRIIGGAVEDSFSQNFINTAQRHVGRYVNNLDLGEIEPIALLENIFHFEGASHVHKGILFIARARNFDDREIVGSLATSRGHFVPFLINNDPPHLSQTYQQEAYGHAIKVASEALKLVSQDHEIDSNQSYRARYQFHDAFIKPAMKAASRFIGKYSINEFEDKVTNEIVEGKPESVFDIACGENRSLISLVEAEQVSTFVGNDISWSQIELIDYSAMPERFRNNNGIVFFTNNDGRRLPFRDNAFDVGICKNVLHHMPDSKSVRALLRELKRVSKKAIVVEVMDPAYEGGGWARLRHRYYIDFLKDAGGNFLSKAEFADLIKEVGAAETYDVPTLRGIYQFAIFRS